mgnify:CR=1 FL=1
MEDHYASYLWLHEQTWEDYKEKRAEYSKLQLEITRQQERGRDVSNNRTPKAADVHLQYCGRDNFRARLTEHAFEVAREPFSIVDERLRQE